MQTGQTRAVTACLLATAVGVWACNDMVAPRRPAQNPIRPAFLINPAGMVTVSPQDMHGWLFYDDQHDTLCTDTTFCALTDGPRGMPLGSGSARLKLDSASDGKALLLPDYGGTRLDDISALSYATFRQSRDPGANLAISLQFNVDYDLTDSATAWQGRLVYEPYLTNGGEVPDTTWQIWNALQGKWWGTKTSVWRQGTQVTNPCLQATPCTWSQVLTYFPDIGIHTRYGAVVLKAGSGWSSFTGNVDALTIGISGVVTTFNFDRSSPTAYVPATAPDSLSSALLDTLGTITRVAYTGPPWIRSLLDVVFNQGVSQDARQAA